MMSKPTLKDYIKYVDEHMTNEDNIKDRMHKWNLQEFQIYFGHTISKEKDDEWFNKVGERVRLVGRAK